MLDVGFVVVELVVLPAVPLVVLVLPAPPEPAVVAVVLGLSGESDPEEQAAVPCATAATTNEISAEFLKFEYRMFAPSFETHRSIGFALLRERKPRAHVGRPRRPEMTFDLDTMTIENTRVKANRGQLSVFTAHFEGLTNRGILCLAATSEGHAMQVFDCRWWTSCPFLVVVACSSTPKAVNPAGSPEREKTMPTFTTFADDVAFLAQVRTRPGVRIAERRARRRLRQVPRPRDDERRRAEGRKPRLRSIASSSRRARPATPFDNYGGEDRFWLGPEGGQYGLYFPPGKPFVFDNWQTPARHARRRVGRRRSARPGAVTFARTHGGDQLRGHALRRRRRAQGVAAFGRRRDEARSASPCRRRQVGRLRDVEHDHEQGQRRRGRRRRGLAQRVDPRHVRARRRAPTSSCPSKPERRRARSSTIATSARCLPIASRDEATGFLRVQVRRKYRSKIGLGPARAKPVLGSYSDESRLLTIVLYTKPEGATRYVNSMWEIQKEPYGGRRGQQLQRRPHRAGQAVARRLLRDRVELARRRSRARRQADARPPDLPFHRSPRSLGPDQPESARREPRRARAGPLSFRGSGDSLVNVREESFGAKAILLLRRMGGVASATATLAAAACASTAEHPPQISTRMARCSRAPEATGRTRE